MAFWEGSIIFTLVKITALFISLYSQDQLHTKNCTNKLTLNNVNNFYSFK